MPRNLKRWVPFVGISLLLVVLTVIWYVTFPPSVWVDTPNYFGMYVGFLASQGLNAFLNVNTGPGGVIVALSFLPTYVLIGIHVVLERFGKQMKWPVSIVNKYYLVYLVVLALFTISIQNASQHYNWYWNSELNAPGYVDTWTHILSPWLLGSLIVPFALERYLGWDRRLMWFFMFTVLASVALLWEIAETSDVYLNPSPSYFNYPMDSIKDIIMGAGIGTVLSTWFYENIVVHLSEKHQVLGAQSLPTTPLHFLAIAPLHFRRPNVFDVTALFYSSMAVDLELLFSFMLSGSLTHGVWHSYLFVLTIYPVAVGLFVYAVERWLEGTTFGVYGFFRFYPEKVRYPFRTVYLCCLIGGVSHIFFDMWTHEVSSYILFPIVTKNPFWIGDWSYVVFALMVLLSFYTVFLWARQMLIHRRVRQGNA